MLAHKLIPVLKNVHTNFDFSVSLCFQVRGLCRPTDGGTGKTCNVDCHMINCQASYMNFVRRTFWTCDDCFCLPSLLMKGKCVVEPEKLPHS